MEVEFKEILKDFLQEKELTQVAFAKIIGVKQSQVSEWLKGKAKPGYDILRSMAISFDISADYFLGITDNF
ncbi:MAG: helix-turn-helix transcriptional regulator [Clostridia bacterium]|jgi:transcriptional regulator with XRE-family HTH domain|nr:helix-turn-helix transcriptional regulator [Clostridia bacterium]